MACAPEAQALVVVKLEPLYPKRMLSCPGAKFEMHAGMKYGETRREPFSMRTRAISSMRGRPPRPTPMMVPTISRCSSFGSKPDDFTASSAAAMA